MSYVDGFVIPVAEKKVKEYRAIAQKAGKIWREHGALQYVEAVGDDMNPEGMFASYKKTFKLKPGETLIFSWILYKSRKHRDEVNGKVMSDPRLQKMMSKDNPMPFDLKRMHYGGFKVLVEK